MTWTIFLYGLLPLIAFVVIDAKLGVRWAVVSAILLAVGDIFLSRYMLGSWDPGSFVALGLFLILGSLSVKVDKEIYFKLQPVAMGLIFAAYLLYIQIFGGGVARRYLPLIKSSAPPSLRTGVDRPEMLAALNSGVYLIAGVLILHSALVAWTAFRCRNITWLLMRGVGFWILVLLAGVLMAVRQVMRGA